MSKVDSNRFSKGGYVDVPFAKEMELRGDNLANAIVNLFDFPEDENIKNAAKTAVKEWRNMETTKK